MFATNLRQNMSVGRNRLAAPNAMAEYSFSLSEKKPSHTPAPRRKKHGTPARTVTFSPRQAVRALRAAQSTALLAPQRRQRRRRYVAQAVRQ